MDQPTGKDLFKQPEPQTAIVGPLPQTVAPVNAPVAVDFLSNPEAHLKHAERVAKALKKFLTRKPNGDKVKFNGKDYPRNEDWQFVAAFFGHTPRIRMTQELTDAETGQIIGYLAGCEVVNRDGQVVSYAEAECNRMEPNWSKKPRFQVRSMAQTRASSKALANVFRWVMVLAGLEGTPAEEMVDLPVSHGCCNRCGEDLMFPDEAKKALCRACQKKANASVETINDPQFVEKSVAAVRQKQAAAGGYRRDLAEKRMDEAEYARDRKEGF